MAAAARGSVTAQQHCGCEWPGASTGALPGKQSRRGCIHVASFTASPGLGPQKAVPNRDVYMLLPLLPAQAWVWRRLCRIAPPGAPAKTERKVSSIQEATKDLNLATRSGEGGPRLSSRASGCGRQAGRQASRQAGRHADEAAAVWAANTGLGWHKPQAGHMTGVVARLPAGLPARRLLLPPARLLLQAAVSLSAIPP